MRRRTILGGLGLLTLAAGGLGAGAAAAGETVQVAIETRSGMVALEVELARTPGERARGLMFRESLAEREGMLFDFLEEAPVVFWMKNTPLPLDMVFIGADGIVRNIHPYAVPMSLDHIPSGGPVRWVLEIEGGETSRLGIARGDRLVLPPGID